MKRVEGTGWMTALCVSFACATAFCSGPIVQFVAPPGQQAKRPTPATSQPSQSVLRPSPAKMEAATARRSESSRRMNLPAPIQRPQVSSQPTAATPAPIVAAQPSAEQVQRTGNPTASGAKPQVRVAARPKQRAPVSEQARAAASFINTYTGAPNTPASPPLNVIAPPQLPETVKQESLTVETITVRQREQAGELQPIRLEPTPAPVIRPAAPIVSASEPIVKKPLAAPIIPLQPENAAVNEPAPIETAPGATLPPIQAPQISPQAAKARQVPAVASKPSAPMVATPRVSSVAPQKLKTPQSTHVRSALLPARIQSARRPVVRPATPTPTSPSVTPKPITKPSPAPAPKPNTSSQSTSNTKPLKPLRIVAAGQAVKTTVKKKPVVSAPQPLVKVAAERRPTTAKQQHPVRTARLIRFVPPRKDSELVKKIVGPTVDLDLASTKLQQPTVPVSQSKTLNTIDDDDFDLKPIGNVGLNVRPPEGELPPNHAAAKFARKGEIVQRMGARRDWNMFRFTWEASALAHRPLYFEDPNLERYGQSHGILQPFYSAVHFFGRVPFIPYMRGAYPPLKPIYALGYYRPGSYAPYNVHLPKPSIKGAAYEAAAAVGLIYLLP